MTAKTATLSTRWAVFAFGCFAFGCIENTSYVTQERSDKVAKYILKKAPKIEHPAEINLEGKVVFLGYDLKAEDPRPGSKIEVTWYWKSVQELGPGWRLFTHGIGDDDEKMNRDGSGPVRGSYQPEHWRPGQIIKDVQPINIPKDWSSERLELRTGIWKGSARLRGKHGMDLSNRVKGPVVNVSVKPRKPPLTVAFAPVAPTIDGNISGDPAWKSVKPLRAFVHTVKGSPVKERTEVRLLWDEQYLYAAFDATDDDLKSKYTEHDDELWHEDAFEIFIDPGADKKHYYELQVNPKGVVFDSYLPRYRKNTNEWSSNMRVKIRAVGTLNNHSDTDTGWAGELAIPFAEMKNGGGVPPKPSDIWAVNFFRIDAGDERKNSYSGWSPPMRGDFHTLGKFGRIRFGEKPVDSQAEAASTETPSAPQAPPSAAADPKQPAPSDESKIKSRDSKSGPAPKASSR